MHTHEDSFYLREFIYLFICLFMYLFMFIYLRMDERVKNHKPHIEQILIFQ
jgi:hypothetical protein